MNNIRGKTLAFAIIISLLIGASGTYVFLNGLDNQVGDDKQPVLAETVDAKEDLDAVTKFLSAMELITERYVDEVDEKVLLEGAIAGMVNALEDPYSVYMDEEAASQFMEALDSHFEGIGAEVSMTNGQVTIVSPIRDSPAEKAGIMPKDRIVEIDGENIEGLTLYDAVLKIRGEKGTNVVLTIDRPTSSELIEISVKRDVIPHETVRVKTMDHKDKTIGVLEITSFSNDTSERFERELLALEQQGIDGLIIDVRGNPGGLLNVAEEIGKLVIPGGKPIVQIENRDGEKVRYISSLEEEKDYPIIGLIDNGSASASEIIAGALKEAGNYDLVGETTFGKGTVQQALKLGDGSEIKLSLFKWLTSDGNFINEVGVEPTVKVSQPEFFYLPPLHVKEDLTHDMLNEQVRSAQHMLKGLGFEPDRTDGYFSKQTEKAVMAFQNTNNLEATGVIDEDTASAIHEAIVEAVRDEKNDHQLQAAIELIIKQSES
ncbi:peptidase S41 [Alkalihalophilus pseudofirmus]|uniref:S41 family peptidase n=1 Tax=Alkalihalobacterium alkalinitrilicum TaxID=427920 RepID=UPI00094D85BB|nr:S41 family peptidase [Alkalihalobacterium alkalinitrilicum]OLO38123.1 peptidase S41 [Alkalihalophilus pseudofirmus]